MSNCPHCGEATWTEGKGCELGCHERAEVTAERALVITECDVVAHMNVASLHSELLATKAKLAEVEAERDDLAERIDELQHACEVVSSEFEGELWQACRRLLKKTGFDFHGADVDGIQADDFESHMNETLSAFDSECARSAIAKTKGE